MSSCIVVGSKGQLTIYGCREVYSTDFTIQRPKHSLLVPAYAYISIVSLGMLRNKLTVSQKRPFRGYKTGI